MSNLNLWQKGQRTLHNLCPGLQFFSILQGACGVARQVLPVLFLSASVQALTQKNKAYLIILGIFFALQAALFFTESILSTALETKTNLLLFNEQQSVSDILMKIPYTDFVSKDLQEKISAYKSSLAHNGSAFQVLVGWTSAWLRGLLGLGLSVWLLLPFLRTLFKSAAADTATGTAWLDSPWFGIALLLILALGGGLITLISARSNRKVFRLRKDYIHANRLFRSYADLLQTPKNTKEIRLYQAQGLIMEQATRDIAGRGLETQRKISRVIALSGIGMAVIAAVLAGSAYFFLGSKGLSGVLSPGDIVRSIGSFLQLIYAVTLLSENAGRLRSYLPGLGYYFDITSTPLTDEKSQVASDSTSNPIPDNLTIEFKHVSYRYPGTERDALSDVSITLHPGETLAIVGENGSGKSTFVKLLCRLLEPQEGKILLGGINIQTISNDEYNRLLSVVFQDFCLLALPVADNIACTHNCNPPSLSKLFSQVHLPSAIANRGDGSTLSGGEAQRTAIARALQRDAPIVIFDEPTASLDPMAEREIYRGFADLTNGKTAVYISHRLASCRFCRRVAVFENGRLTQLGTHEELLTQTGGKYARMWEAQAGLYERG